MAPSSAELLSDRFVKLLGMLGSNAAGERENAAVAVEALRRKSGLAWADIIRQEVG